jgi:hypothetical protein
MHIFDLYYFTKRKILIEISPPSGMYEHTTWRRRLVRWLLPYTNMHVNTCRIDNEPSWPMKGLNRSQLIATLLSTTHWQWNKSCANLRIVWTISKHFRPGGWTPFSAIKRLWLYNLRAYAITWETDKRELEPRHNTPHNMLTAAKFSSPFQEKITSNWPHTAKALRYVYHWRVSHYH